MVTIVKHEWHRVDRQYCLELGEDILSEIYPDMDEDEIANLMEQLENGEADIEDIINEAWQNDIEIEWEHQYDDCWTDRKGGYEVTYEYGDEDSYHHEPAPLEPTHKCVNCKWVGQSYDADWKFPEDEDSEEEPTKICPMCDSDTELTEVGLKEEKEKQEREARWAKEEAENEQEVPCFSCGAMHKESELPELSGQYHCPDCHEGWVMMDMREEDVAERTKELEDALEELKQEFEKLMETEDIKEDKGSTHWPSPNSNFVETAKWPFDKPNELEPNAKWPFPDAANPDDEEEEFQDDLKVLQEAFKDEPEEVLPNYPAGVYTIRVWGRTREIGVGTITKAQYDYWSSDDRSYGDLSDALNENYDYDEEGTPEEARFDMPYYEYQDVQSLWGFDEDDTSMTIENEKGEEIYSGDVSSFVAEAHGENDSRWDATEEVDEMYPRYLGKGTFVVWTQGGKGSCIQTTIDTEGEEFDPRKFGYKTYDIEGATIISRLVYDNDELDDEGMDEDNWRGQWSEFNVYENEE